MPTATHIQTRPQQLPDHAPSGPQQGGRPPQAPSSFSDAYEQSLTRSLSLPMADSNPRLLKKRIIVCCDGTWMDGIVVTERWKYTNVLRLSRAINHVDTRFNVPIPQIVFYQSGIGSANNLYDEVVDGVTGASLGDKVEEAYAFLAQNYAPGDEIFLFGFSRGAYTARMVADFIGAIGVLDRKDMDYFAGIFVALQKRGKSTDPDEIRTLDEQLSPWTGHDSPGKRRADSGPHSFSIKCVGVFDTVGSVGLPEEVTIRSEKIKTIFGFRDNILGEHIERAYQALALNEKRKDFDCSKFHQTPSGLQKGQILRQVRSHADIGGGYKEHDLSDLSLTWMAANIGDILSLDINYIATLRIRSITGIFSIATTIQRKLPTNTNNVTHETIHPSVLMQQSLIPALADDLRAHPGVVGSLLPLEIELKANWPYVPGKGVTAAQTLQDPLARIVTKDNLVNQAVKDIKPDNHNHADAPHGAHFAAQKRWLHRHSEETSMGSLVKELLW
ncbi:hypothetical protein B0H21DRAFT_723255 [Amylocystis lapponica]|nr:hypothetical protein B0H21DRAFT_723255 [Amylocystis lapponica]